jgi:hypothetical protein
MALRELSLLARSGGRCALEICHYGLTGYCCRTGCRASPLKAFDNSISLTEFTDDRRWLLLDLVLRDRYCQLIKCLGVPDLPEKQAA